MESNWLWNGWVGSGQNAVAEIAARLLAPIGGRDWLFRSDADPLRLLILAVYDNTVGFTDFDPVAIVPPTGFPYGFSVTQDRLVL